MSLLILVGLGYWSEGLFGVGLGVMNLVIGTFTRNAGGVSIPADPQSPVKLSVDKGVIGPTIYEMAFSNNKLVLKKLSSGRTTILTAILLAITGYAVAGLIGALEGGVTAFALQEFVTQQRRNTVEKTNLLDSSSPGDLEFSYDHLEKVELTRNRVRLYLPEGRIGIVVSRKYPKKMEEVLGRIIPASRIQNASG